MIEIKHGDCLDILKSMEADSIDALVTDPPAGINFMNLEFDSDKGGRDQWIAWLSSVMKECMRVMKPGSHGLVWALPRTSHWTATACEDAGFRIKDCVQHLFGSGFHKSHSCKNIGRPELGSALKPAVEIWWLIQKPLEKGFTIDKNVLKHGCGALNIDASRIDFQSEADRASSVPGGKVSYTSESWGQQAGLKKDLQPKREPPSGRFPANLVLSHSPDCVEVGVKQIGSGDAKKGSTPRSNIGFKLSPSSADRSNSIVNYGTETVAAWECTEGCAVAELDRQSGVLKSGDHKSTYFQKASPNLSMSGGNTARFQKDRPGDSGGASRFFKTFSPEVPFYYCAKASKSEKNAGCDLDVKKAVGARPNSGDMTGKFPDHDQRERIGNFHPTVKSTKLMSYLITMITPPNGTVLDPFAGSGSTGVAAIQSGFKFVGIEREKEYVEIANKRIYHALPLFKKQIHEKESD